MKTRRSCIMRNKTQAGRLARKAYLFLLPSLAGTAVFVLLPYVDVVRRSFFEAAGGRFVAMQNYVTVVGNSAFRLASFNTLRFLVICVPLLVVVSLFCSMMIAGLKEGGTVFKTSLLVPLAIPVASIVLLWKLFFHPQGMVNQITALFGMAGVDWINGDTAFGVLVFTYVWKNLGYDVVLWVAGLAAISDELYEAARVDGASSFRIFGNIILPLIVPGIAAVAIFVLFSGWNEYMYSSVLISNDQLKTLTVGIISLNSQYQIKWNDLMAASTVSSLPLMVLFICFQKYFIAGMTGGAVKS